MASVSLDDLRSSGIALFAQDSRLLTLRFAESSGLNDDQLLPHRLVGEESFSHSYRYTLDCLSADVHLELKDLLGQPVEIALRLADGGERLLCGLVTRAEQLGADGGFARYRLTVEPALATLAHRRNSRVFQDQTVPDIVAALLDEHRAANPAFTRSFQHRARLEQTYPVRSYTLQYRESDLAFLERLLAEEGIGYRYGHGADPATSLRAPGAADADDTPRHTLILFDTNPPLPPDGPDGIRFHRTDGAESADAIDRWQGCRQVQAGQTQLASYDYRAAATYTGEARSRTEHGEAGRELAEGLEDYAPQAAYYGATPDEMARYTALRQQAKDLASKRFSGEGSVRSLSPGSAFELLDHPIHDQDAAEDRAFLVTGLAFEAENNLTPEARQNLGRLFADDSVRPNRPPYRNRFTVVRRHVLVVPAYSDSRHQKPTAHGLTTATVVGPADEEIFTDDQGRIKIQFHWQRPADHPDGGAQWDERSSTWVRVAMPSAGAGWGSQFIPRIGQEVVIDFIEGDIDRPLAIGVVYNGSHRPPAFSGAGSLPANKALSGHQSKEYRGSRYNELLFDDSTGELRTKLSSEHGKTQLNQGYLVHPRTEGKGEPRGEGFELRTDRQGALRARGLLLTAWQRFNATGSQLSRDETLGLMDECLSLFKQLGEAAARHQGGPADPEPQQALHQAFRDWEHGGNTAPDAPNGQAPVIGITAPGGIHRSTPGNQVDYAGRNLDQVAQQHLQLTAGQRCTLNAGQGISLFAHDAGLKAIAHRGPLLLQSQHDDTVVNAEQNVTVTASRGKITLQSKGDIVNIVSGGSYIKLVGGNVEIGGPGAFTAKAAKHNWHGPSRMTPAHPDFPEGLLKKRLIVNFDNAPQGIRNGWAGMPYKLYADGALIKEDVLGESTSLPVEHAVSTQNYKLELANGMAYDIPVPVEYGNPDQGEPANQGFLRHVAGQAPDTGATAQKESMREDYFKGLNGGGEGSEA